MRCSCATACVIKPCRAFDSGSSPLGVTPNGDDPLSKALQGLITHAVAQEQRIETILATLKAAGICCQAVPECDKFDSEQMNKLVD